MKGKGIMLVLGLSLLVAVPAWGFDFGDSLRESHQQDEINELQGKMRDLELDRTLHPSSTSGNIPRYGDEGGQPSSRIDRHPSRGSGWSPGETLRSRGKSLGE
jgi:hypothetical protein